MDRSLLEVSTKAHPPRLRLLSASLWLGAAVAVVLAPGACIIAQTASPAPQPPQQSAPDDRTVPTCPIRIDEAYVTAEPGAMPIEGAEGKRTLHVSLVDTSGKQIVSYVVHARIPLRPSAPLTDAPPTAAITRKWQGQLDPDSPKKEQWTFPADKFAVGLRRVWFDKVTFADGSKWNKTADDRCSFAATGHVVQTR